MNGSIHSIYYLSLKRKNSFAYDVQLFTKASVEIKAQVQYNKTYKHNQPYKRCVSCLAKPLLGCTPKKDST